MKDIMMTRKNRKLYERIKRAQSGKAERVGVLEQRKRKLQEAAGEEPGSGAGGAASAKKAGPASKASPGMVASPGVAMRRSTRLHSS